MRERPPAGGCTGREPIVGRYFPAVSGVSGAWVVAPGWL